MPRFCHLAAGAIGFYLQEEKRRVYDMYRLRETQDIGDLLEEELGTDYAGEFLDWLWRGCRLAGRLA